MKAEQRKALETNTLAKQLGKAIEGVKHGASRSTLFYVGAAVLVILVVVLFRYFSRTSEATASGRWVQFDGIVFPEQLDEALEGGLKDTPQSRLVRFKEARMKLTEGLRDLGANSEEAKKKIEKGTELYEELLKASTRVPLLHQEALWGAAKGYEALGDVEKALEYYEKLVKEYPVSALGKDAATRREHLTSPAGKKDVLELTKLLAPPR